MWDRGSEIQRKELLVRKSNSIGRSGETGYVASPRFPSCSKYSEAGGAENSGLVPSTYMVAQNPLEL